MKGRKLAITRTAAVLALAVTLCIIPSSPVRGDGPPNIWIDLYGTASYLGQPAPVGAHIQVFDQRGVQCGEMVVTTLGAMSPVMPCYGDDGVYPGARFGDVLRFTINGATAEVEVVSPPGQTVVTWAPSVSLLWQVNLHARLDVTDHLLVSSANPANLGQAVTFSTALIGPGTVKPTGNVVFSDGGVVLGTVPLDGLGQASFPTAALTGGTHTITAAYEGDAVFYPSTASLTQVVYYPHLSLTKAATEASFNAIGTILHYTLIATNDGNVTLTGVGISDPKLGSLTCNPAQPATLAPGGTLTCTGSYVTTQADLDAGKVDNTAQASGLYGTTPVAAVPASASVPAVQSPHLSLTKAATEASFNAIGTILHYTLIATNDGNVTLTGVGISDPKLGSLTCDPAQPATLAPGGILTCTGSYVTTEVDLDAGKVDNTAQASGLSGTTPVAAVPASVSVPAIQSPHLSLTKAATEASFNAAGVTLHYTLMATNDGNVTLTGVSISDPKLGTLTCAQPAMLAPGGTLTCTGSYVTTEVDLDAGKVDNTAEASGLFGATPVAAVPASAAVPAARTSVTFTSAPNPSLLGETVTFTMTVTGSGPHGEKPTGNVQFAADGTAFGAVPLDSNGQATITKADLTAGTHTITATYSGDTVFHSGTASLTQRVRLPSTLALVSSANPVYLGQLVTFTASVTPAGATGQVDFFDGATPLGRVALSGGTCALPPSDLSAGTHSITAVYGGDDTYAGSTSPALQQVVANLLNADKQQLILDLQALLPTLHKDDNPKLTSAIAHLQKSLNPYLWIDGLHPKPGRNGEIVFNEEKAAAVNLRDLGARNKSGLTPAQMKVYIDRLVKIDRTLAALAISEAEARGGNAAKILSAQKALAEGDVQWSKNAYDKAIDKYKTAWKYAIAA